MSLFFHTKALLITDESDLGDAEVEPELKLGAVDVVAGPVGTWVGPPGIFINGVLLICAGGSGLLGRSACALSTTGPGAVLRAALGRGTLGNWGCGNGGEGRGPTGLRRTGP